MIEWVPIKEFLKQVGGTEYFLVCHTGRKIVRGEFVDGSNMAWLMDNYTHAAKINLPVKKTLEEKFLDCYENLKQGPFLTYVLVDHLARIAKQHYEENLK